MEKQTGSEDNLGYDDYVSPDPRPISEDFGIYPGDLLSSPPTGCSPPPPPCSGYKTVGSSADSGVSKIEINL